MQENDKHTNYEEQALWLRGIKAPDYADDVIFVWSVRIKKLSGEENFDELLECGRALTPELRHIIEQGQNEAGARISAAYISHTISTLARVLHGADVDQNNPEFRALADAVVSTLFLLVDPQTSVRIDGRKIAKETLSYIEDKDPFKTLIATHHNDY